MTFHIWVLLGHLYNSTNIKISFFMIFNKLFKNEKETTQNFFKK